MKQIYIYRKWNFIVYLNGALNAGFFTYNKKITSLRFDIGKSFFWVYSKKSKFQQSKVIKLKRRFNFLK
jgi:hypothetical protein